MQKPRVKRVFLFPKDIRVVIQAPSVDAIFDGYRHLARVRKTGMVHARDRKRYIKAIEDAV